MSRFLQDPGARARASQDLPGWWGSKDGLSHDPELRQKQLEYIVQDIKQRRWVLLTVIVVNIFAYIALGLSPSWPTLAGAGVSTLLAIPVVHYFRAAG